MRFRGTWLPLVAALALPGALRAQDEEHPGTERPGMIGVILDNEQGDGVRIIEVRRGSPADAAGVREGDIVVRLNGEDAAASLDDLPSRLHAGDTVRLRIRRDGEGEREVVMVAEARQPARRFSVVRPGGNESIVIINGDTMRLPALQALTGRIDSLRTHLMELGEGRTFRVEVDSMVRMYSDSAGVWMQRMPRMDFRMEPMPMPMGEGVVAEGMPFESGRPFFMELGRRAAAGAELAEMNEGLSAYFGGQREGALVIEVSPESPAARAGLQPGDVIVRAGGESVEDPADVRAALNRAEAGHVALEVIRQGRRQELSLEWTGDRFIQREIRVEPARVRARVREPEN